MAAAPYKKLDCNFYFIITLTLVTTINYGLGASEDTDSIPSASTVLGNLYRQARSEYYGSRYGGVENPSVTSGTIGIRSVEPEHRDAAYYESRCITCDSTKPTPYERGWRQKVKYDYYDDDYDMRKYRDRYDDYDRFRGYEYDRPRGAALDYDRARVPDYDGRMPVPYDYDRYDVPGRNDLRIPDRYDPLKRDRYGDRLPDRGNGYDNLDQRQVGYGSRYDPYGSSTRRPAVDDRYNRPYPPRYDQYERYDPYDRNYYRRPYDERYDRFPSRAGGGSPDLRGYYGSSAWGPGYERDYSSSWNYSGYRDYWRESPRDRDPASGDTWRDLNRDRDTRPYRPRDYFYDSTASPVGSRGTNYLHDRPESSTKPDATEREKPTSSPQTQDNNKVYKD